MAAIQFLSRGALQANLACMVIYDPIGSGLVGRTLITVEDFSHPVLPENGSKVAGCNLQRCKDVQTGELLYYPVQFLLPSDAMNFQMQ